MVAPNMCPDAKDRAALLTLGTSESCVFNADCPPGIQCVCPPTGPCSLTNRVCDAPSGTTCADDDACPIGSRCDQAELSCVFDCIATDDPDFGCEEGLVCDCEGRCAPPLVPEYADPPPPVTMSLQPANMTVTAADWAPRRFAVVLESAVEPIEMPVVQVSAGPSSQVSCAATPTGLSHSCAPLTDWTFEQVGNRYRAIRHVWAAPHPNADATDVWSIEVATLATATPHQTATIALDDDAALSLPAAFAGELVQLDASGRTGIALPVTAWVFDEAIVFFDPQRVLTPAGKLVVSRAMSEFQLFYWIADPDQEESASYAGADISLDEASFSVTPSRAQGSFDLVFDWAMGKQTWRFDLGRQDDIAPSACPCAVGFNCDRRLEVCLPGDPWDVVDIAGRLLGLGYSQAVVDMLLPYLRTNRLFNALSIADHPTWLHVGRKLYGWVRRELQWDHAANAPADPQASEQVVLCYDPIARDGTAIGTEVLPVSGDLACNNGDSLRGVELATHRDTNGTVGAGDMLRACVEELAAPTPAVISGDMTDVMAEQVLARGTCVSKVLFFFALDWANNGRRYQLVGRLAQQWIQLHSFVAMQGMQERHLADVLGDDPEVGAGDAAALAGTPSWETLLATTAAGWRVALDYWTYVPLNNRTVAQLRNPDYRGASADDHEVINAGVAVTMVEGASATLDLVGGYLAAKHADAYAQCSYGAPGSLGAQALTRAGDLVRHAMLATSYADQMFDTADLARCELTECGDGGTCAAGLCTGPGFEPGEFDWRDRYLTARGEYRAKLAGVTERMTQIAQCRNPLGLPDDYTPVFFRERVDVADRFFANSDYILDEWAQPAHDRSETLVVAARTKWLSIRNADIQQQLDTDARDRRIEEVRSRYGRTLLSLCGMTDAEPASALALFTSPTSTVTGDNCFLTGANQCEVTTSDARNAVTEDAVRYQLCLYDAVRDQVDLSGNAFEGVSMATAATSFRTATVASGMVHAGGATFDSKLLYIVPPGFERISEGVRAAADRACQSELGGATYLPAAIDVNPQLNTSAECYRGTLGEAQLALFSANQAIIAAHARYQASRNRFEAQVQHCADKQERFDVNQSLREEHAATINALQEETLALNRILDQSAWMAQFTSNPYSWAFDALHGTVFGGGNPFQTLDAKTSLRELENTMREEQRAFDNLMAARAEEETIIDCFHQATLIKDSINTSLLEFRVAAAEFESSRLRLANTTTQFEQTVAEGRAAVERELRSVGPDFAHHQWIDETVDEYQYQFERAKRFAYLAARAAEYDFQRSLPERGEAVTARRPSDLVPLLDDLRGYQAAPIIGDGEPADFSRVLGLRDDILGLTDIVVGEGDAAVTITKEQRLQSRLLRESAHIYAANGTYLGRGFRFTLDEDDFVATHCAERGWYLSADVAGSGLSGTRTPLLVFKSNTGFSQSCNAEPMAEVYQVGAVRMSVNPFLSEVDSGESIAEQRFSSGTINASINDADGEFGGPGDFGSTRAFAGRGVFGEYIIVFPWNESDQSFDIDLRKITEVQLRFDYLYGENAPSP